MEIPNRPGSAIPERPAEAATTILDTASASPESSEALAQVLGPTTGRSRLSRGWHGLLALGVVLALAAVGYAWLSRGTSAAPQYRTAQVTRGNLVVSVTATGNLQPTNQVDVGSELSGTMEAVLVDVNDTVKRGQVLARLDTTRLQHELDNARGGLAASQAQVHLTAATVQETALQYKRLQSIFKSSSGTLVSQFDLDAAEAAWKRAVAANAGAIAAVAQAKAARDSDQTNLSKAIIRSPIDGVVLTRNIEPGQTVAASLQAPVLFSLAEDLSKMELQVDVDEADVGQVHDGQRATFTVDAYPGREYPAVIRRVGYGSQTKDGVVSYLTVLTVDNDDLTLRPGMTATATIVVSEQKNALLIPNAALRFTPETGEAKTESGGFISRLLPHPPHRSTPKKVKVTGMSRQVWVLHDGQPQAVTITTGASDGKLTEVSSGALQPGMPVILERLGTPP